MSESASICANIIVIHYNEIALKGRNRPVFEATLIKNIKKTLKNEKYITISKRASRLIIELSKDSSLDSILSKLKKVFAIQWIAFGISVNKNIDILKKEVLNFADIYKNKTIKLETKRADKSFPLKSIEINKEIGQWLEANGFNVDLKKPEMRIHIEVLNTEVLVLSDKIFGLGGLPAGTSGKLLCLFSGGIDSPVAAWLMMKRGCVVDFLHVAHENEFSNIKNSKLMKILEKLKEYAPIQMQLYVLPYFEFYKKTFDMQSRNELVVFKRFLLRLAEKLCRDKNYLGIVTGDAVAQVASQTLNNLYATDTITNLPIYRPLTSYDKAEIIDLAKKIETYDISIEQYKDCCSLIATKHPNTMAKIENVDRIEKEIGIDEVVRETLARLEIIYV